MANAPQFSYKNIAAGATTVVHTGAGILHSIVNNSAVASKTITVYDNSAASGTKIATITNPATLLANQYSLLYDVVFTTGLTVVTSGDDDVTVCWSPVAGAVS